MRYEKLEELKRTEMAEWEMKLSEFGVKIKALEEEKAEAVASLKLQV